jgi:hypothetical protein
MTVALTVITMVKQSGPEGGHRANPVEGIEPASALMDALTDEFSRKIVGSTVSVGKTVKEISAEQRIPASTCYRKVKLLVGKGVLLVERRAKRDKGKGHAVYRSVFSSLRVEMKDGEVTIQVTVNPDIAGKLDRQESGREGRQG